MKNIDNIFDQQIIGVEDFEFNQRVADVFDDMVSRSVPIYTEIHRILIDLTNYIFTNTNSPVIYDLGCSTGTTLTLLSKKIIEQGKTPTLIGIDNSLPMAKKAKEKLDGTFGKVEIRHEDLLTTQLDTPADLVVMNYTLQFIAEDKREDFLRKVYKALKPGATFILSEKINPELKSNFNLITDLYYDFKKRNGYSELEISQKREALENVMKPMTPSKQLEVLSSVGFKNSEMIFRWYNFASYLCVK
jgi:tRNA (cmo5U34)-methyltransferase